jgi:hypothetical protein
MNYTIAMDSCQVYKWILTYLLHSFSCTGGQKERAQQGVAKPFVPMHLRRMRGSTLYQIVAHESIELTLF